MAAAAENVRTPFLAAARFTVADVVLYACTHLAGRGGFATGDYPAVASWLDRVAAQPGHVTFA